MNPTPKPCIKGQHRWLYKIEYGRSPRQKVCKKCGAKIIVNTANRSSFWRTE